MLGELKKYLNFLELVHELPNLNVEDSIYHSFNKALLLLLPEPEY